MNHDHRAASLQYWEETHRAQGYSRDAIRVDDWLDLMRMSVTLLK